MWRRTSCWTKCWAAGGRGSPAGGGVEHFVGNRDALQETGVRGYAVEGGKGMSKAVMISIRPKWCEKIASGEKTIEVRKTRPKLETPFKCYIYRTKGTVPHIINDKWVQMEVGGTVIGEFTCDRIDSLTPANEPYSIYDIDDDYVLQTCLENGALWDYGHGTQLYGWHISDLKIYEQPKKLSEFIGIKTMRDGFELRVLELPPQSWCYVEEVRWE